MAAAAVVSAVRERLNAYLVVEDVLLFRGSSTRDKFEWLNSQLVVVENFLKSLENNRDDVLEKIAIQLAYDVEDVVDYLALKHEWKDHWNWSIKTLLKFPSSHQVHRRHDFQTLKVRIDELVRKLLRITDYQNNTIPSSSFFFLTTLVGMEGDFEMVRNLLLTGIDAVTTISGVSGVGKTTLAKRLYDDPTVILNFHSRAWVTVGEQFHDRGMIENISSNFLFSSTIPELVEKDRRSLLVLDDVPSVQVWESIKFSDFSLYRGTKILITTRGKEVGLCKYGCYIHEMKTLPNDQGCQLFKIQSGAPVENSKQLSRETEEIVSKIVNCCQGLPLAINLVGGILKGKEDWAEALEALLQALLREQNKYNQHLDLGGGGTLLLLEKVVSLSYNHLPFHLKPCFLYLGHFPADQVISVEKLYLLLMAEGLISTARYQSHKIRMDAVEEYMLALVQRNLVLMEKEDVLGSRRIMKSFKLQNQIRNLCISIGEKEEFFGVADFNQGNKSLYLLRRTTLYTDHKYDDDDDDDDADDDNNDDYDVYSLNISEPKHVRSLFFFSSKSKLWPKELAVDLKKFRWTRVLDFNQVDFRVEKLPKGIEKLHYLRYLSFRGCYVEELPSSLSKFPFLETLDLSVKTSCKMTIHANVLRNMSRLRHLYFPLAYQSATDDKLKLDGLKKLEVLVNFHAGICDADHLPMLRNLEIFEGIGDGNNDNLEKMINFIQGNELVLSHSSLTIKNCDSSLDERLSVVTALLTCGCLHHLDIEEILFELILPLPWQFGSNLTNIDPMPTLGKLPQLRNLVLCNGAFVGKKIMCAEAEFVRLRCLKLLYLWGLREFEVEIGALPCLSNFMVMRCDNLKMLPDYLMEIPTLEQVTIACMPKEFKALVRRKAEDQLSKGHSLFVNFCGK
ncbi:hypothetical protein ACJIZ3_020778 [Penstemon smallii]|uniref:NB-ARC domain-containing protein n=1 Tax=Penstemon smallii TaxID=265156 RepID=A0ABD3SJK1_9LAMI